MQLQQFSTAPPWAVVAAAAGAPREIDVILEPSAGTGSLLRVALMGARKMRGKAVPAIHANEIDPFRAAILSATLDRASLTGHDAEFIDDLLAADVAPTLVLMNPPFASSAARSDDASIALRHAISAAKRLAPGGRLVAILPPAASPERQPELWRRFVHQVQPLARLVLPRTAFAKIGSPDTHFRLVGRDHGAQRDYAHADLLLAESARTDVHEPIVDWLVQRDVVSREPPSRVLPRPAVR